MSEQYMGFYFSCNADLSANDYTLYMSQTSRKDIVKLEVRYKNAEPNRLYEIEMDAEDLHRLGELCMFLASQIKTL